MFGYFEVWARDGCPVWFVDLGWRFLIRFHAEWDLMRRSNDAPDFKGFSQSVSQFSRYRVWRE